MDSEMIGVAVDSEIARPDRAELYPSWPAFYEKNPNCCSIERFSDDQRLPGSISAAFGCHAAWVELFFRQTEKPSHEAPFYDVSMGLSPWGDIGAWLGIDAKGEERPADGKTWREP